MRKKCICDFWKLMCGGLDIMCMLLSILVCKLIWVASYDFYIVISKHIQYWLIGTFVTFIIDVAYMKIVHILIVVFIILLPYCVPFLVEQKCCRSQWHGNGAVSPAAIAFPYLDGLSALRPWFLRCPLFDNAQSLFLTVCGESVSSRSLAACASSAEKIAYLR